jgi:hypothetical protein
VAEISKQRGADCPFGGRPAGAQHDNWPGIVETEGSVAAGFIGSDFEKALAGQTPLGRS